ncbi:MAG TPA: FHA domain-containing protein [Anaerolineae bacterium]|nr:FHA domain-containing protein [Anaerolineae bacterium]
MANAWFAACSKRKTASPLAKPSSCSSISNPMLMSLPTDLASLIRAWYNWGVAIAFAVTFVTTLWIFFDSQSNDCHATLWRWLSLLMAMIVIPSVILSFSPELALGLPLTLINILAITGILATAIALFSLLLYGLGVGVIYPETDPDSSDNGVLLAAASAPASAAPVNRVVTPPQGVPPVTTKEKITPQRITPPGGDTIRIKNALDNEMPLAWLVILNGPFAGQEYRLQRITDIGREPDHNDVVVDDRTISRQHARIRYEKGAFVIYDLASANGVYVDGEKVQRRVLTHGDRIKLGQVMFGVMIVLEDEGAARGEEARLDAFLTRGN